jgi:hypothetical protein
MFQFWISGHRFHIKHQQFIVKNITAIPKTVVLSQPKLVDVFTKTRFVLSKTNVDGGIMATNIKDVAREARVSIATVSLVFNRKPGVRRETRERVLKVARDLNYRRALPHGNDIPKGRTVRFLKISRHGHTVNRDHDSFIADYIAGLDQEARLSKWTVEVNMFANVRAEETVQFLGTWRSTWQAAPNSPRRSSSRTTSWPTAP